MVELPHGHIVEQRRGGANILSNLTADIAKLATSGYIRCETTPKQSLPRVGQIIFSNGKLAAAIHEEKAIIQGIEALIAIESDALELDCKITINELEDVSQLIELFPESIIETEGFEDNRSDKWWHNVETRPQGWTRTNRLPELEASEPAPEYVQRKAAAMRQKQLTIDKVLKSGSTHLFDSNEPTLLYKLAASLQKHGRPVLTMTRTPREDLVVGHGLNSESCLWFSQSESDGVQFVDIDAIRGSVNGFFEGNLRAVLLIEGLEYLSEICGQDALIDLIRDLADRTKMEDHCLLVCADLNAFDTMTSKLLARELPIVSADVLSVWAGEGDGLLDHPLLAPPTEEELLRLAQHVEDTLPPEFVKEEIIIEPFEEELIVELPELEPMDEIIIEKPIIEIIEKTVSEIMEQQITKGPRGAQFVKRRKPAPLNLPNMEEIRRSALSAAQIVETNPQLPGPANIPKIAIGTARVVEFPKTLLGPKPYEAAARNQKEEDS
ncbi:MAG TPA: DUF835 domain-containing protein [Candidatus Poseidoniales archaeon]|jgi:hypothetical protein|nr:DUF835 domain-containing protein [Candidatus Poseidoniales archaeon]